MESESKFINYTRIILAATLVICLGIFAARSIHWPWVGDAQVFHYEIFLLHGGMSPYRQIIDINMPGAYFSEFAGMFFFGGSDIAWRLYDFALLIILIGAAISLTSEYDWYGGLYAGVLFALIHGSEGPQETAERDEVMTVLIVLGFALVFLGVRHRRSLYFFLSGISLSLAATIKPTACLFELLVAFAALFQLRKEEVRILPFLREMIAGTVLVMAGTLGFLLWRGSLHAFASRILILVASYSDLGKEPFSVMLHFSTPRGLILILPIAAILFFRNRSWEDWRIRVIAAGAVLGLVSYFVQGKGFTYHRYPFTALALVWSGLEFIVALRKGRFNALLGGAGLLIGTLLVAPFYLDRTLHFKQTDFLTPQLVKDLRHYPLSELQGTVQCLDGVAGCYSALYRLQLRQSTGLMGDQLLFPSHPSQASKDIREEFFRQIEAAPPKVFIETSYRLGDPQTFKKINTWQEFAEYLRNNYTLVTEWTTGLVTREEPLGYRIYLRNDQGALVGRGQ